MPNFGEGNSDLKAVKPEIVDAKKEGITEGEPNGSEGREQELESLAVGYDRANLLKDEIASVEESQARMEEIRQKEGLGEDTSSSEDSLNSLKKKLQEAEDKNSGVEKEYLGVPEGEPEAKEQITASQEVAEAKVVEKKLRKKFVEDIIEATTKRWLEVGDTGDQSTSGLKDVLDKCGNKEAAAQILGLKTAIDIRKMNKDYIDGKTDEMTEWTASLDLAKFKDADGKEMVYVTGFNFETKDRLIEKEGVEFLTEKEKGVIRGKEKAGELEEEKA